MKYIIYLAVGVLAVWAVWYVIHHVRCQLRGECGCEGDCAGNCCACKKSCTKRERNSSPK